MRYLFVRVSPELRRRLAVAAACDGVPPARYARRIIEPWLVDENRPNLPACDDDAGPYQNYRYAVSDKAHRFARVIAAERDISISTLIIRVLDANTPYEVEALAQAVAGSGG